MRLRALPVGTEKFYESVNSIILTMKRVYRFYYDGFMNLSSWGRKVWIIILIKLFIIFVLLRIFFFPDLLSKNFSSDGDRSNYIRDQILNIK